MKLGDHPNWNKAYVDAKDCEYGDKSYGEAIAEVIEIFRQFDLGDLIPRTIPLDQLRKHLEDPTIPNSWTMVPAGTTKIDYITTGVPLTLEETTESLKTFKNDVEEGNTPSPNLILAWGKLIHHKRAIEAQQKELKDQ